MTDKFKPIDGDTDERRQDYFERSKYASAESFYEYRMSKMTEEERELGRRIIRDFRKSYEAKSNAGVFRDMEIAEAYWSGEFNKTSSANANTNIVNANIETQVADLMDQNIDIELNPYDPSDSPYIPKVKRILTKIFDANEMPLKIQKFVRSVKKFGSGWLRVMFNTKMLDGVGCPEIKWVSTANVFPDASINSVDDINNGRYFIEAYSTPIYWAEKTFGMEKASAIFPGYKPYSMPDINFRTLKQIDLTGENYLHILYWTKYTDQNGKEKLRLIQCSGDGVILQDSLNFTAENQVDVFPETEDVCFPYWVMNDMERENSVWGKTNASLLYPIQDEIDELDNSILANARLTGNPVKLVLTNSGIDPEKIDNTEGQVVLSNVQNGLTYVNAPNLPAYIIDRRNYALMNERVIVSRVSDQQAGIKQSGVDTATESLALQQNAMKSTDATKTILQIVLARVAVYCLELAMEYWDTDMYFETEEEGVFDYFEPSMLKKIPEKVPASKKFKEAFMRTHTDQPAPDYMLKQGKFRKVRVLLNVSIGAGMPRNKAFMYNVIKETYANKAMEVTEYRDKLEEYVGLPAPQTAEQIYTQQPTESGRASQNMQVPFTQSRNAVDSIGAGPSKLEEINQQRTGGNYAIKQ